MSRLLDHELGVSLEGGEWVAQLVREHRRHLAERCQVALAAERRFESFRLRDEPLVEPGSGDERSHRQQSRQQ